LLSLSAAVVGGLLATSRDSSGSTRAKIAQKQIQFESQGAEKGAGAESNDYLTLQQQFAEARTAPSGIVDPGAYSSALGQLNGLPSIAGTWTDVTAVKYDADHPAYRDYFSNSSGGSGLVTGRITGLAADAAGDICGGGRRRRRLAASRKRAQSVLEGDRRRAALALVGRPRVLRRQALLRDG